MQQVKKQLQDAIAEIKSGWGINEVKREGLAAVLEKVVAALDRAAQLPEPDGGGDFGLCFLRVDVIGRDVSVPINKDANAPKWCTPAVKITGCGPMQVQAGFFDPRSRIIYVKDNKGEKFYNTARNKVLYNEKTVFIFSPSPDMTGIAKGLDGSELSGFSEANIV